MPGLTELIWPSAFVVQSIHVVARLGLADFLGPEPRTTDELAKATGVHAPSLKRVLRALTTVGVFAEDADCLRPLLLRTRNRKFESSLRWLIP
jgi:hypothetical protein